MGLKLRPQCVVDAQFSIYFQVAVAWLHGNADWESYRLIGDPRIEAFAQNVFVVPDATLPLNAAIVRVEGMPEMRVDYPLGEPENPLAWEHIHAKFVSLAKHAFEQPTRGEIASSVRMLDNIPSMTSFVRLLRGNMA